MSPRRLVWNDAERRPRAPVRLLATVVVVVFVSLAIGVGVGVALTDLLETSALARLFVSVVLTGATGIGGFVAARYVDRRTIADLGFGVDRDWAVDLVFGLVLGGVLMSGIFAIGLVTGWVVVDGVGFGVDRLTGAAALFLFFISVGIAEELLLRGVVLTDIAEGMRWRFDVPTALTVALVVSSALFGLAHLQNPNASLTSTLSITLAGVMLGLGYVLTGDLAIPVGIHISWNFVQGGVYGFAVSGLDFGSSFVETTERGPDLVTGGAFGPEAGLLGVGAMLVGMAAIALYVRFRYGEVQFDPGVTVPELRWQKK
ncbi:CPBP family intramembrane metalloprotease [Haloferax sp. MBLA0076]|uniref:CPBP family intramembrane metalloprotease n=1 Tax=Haloferax litoreum TaxID=2666140 RepID=A0A6A8GDJ0_9EURY|nr:MULTISPECIES: CPBP family intramembrane glutamic endopeptidase [Haloferax]KAB1192739.1 CPBP family intramembrane metalloprotease [Haloferax sp. CBA1148]MRX21218.1 CPBP family intramembrane metalloprotease [Haloferax litoreum]